MSSNKIWGPDATASLINLRRQLQYSFSYSTNHDENNEIIKFKGHKRRHKFRGYNSYQKLYLFEPLLLEMRLNPANYSSLYTFYFTMLKDIKYNNIINIVNISVIMKIFNILKIPRILK